MFDSGVGAPLPGAPPSEAPLSPRPTSASSREEEERSRDKLDRLSTDKEFRRGLRSIVKKHPSLVEEPDHKLNSYLKRRGITRLDAEGDRVLGVLLTELLEEVQILAKVKDPTFSQGLRAVLHRTHEQTPKERTDAIHKYFTENNIPLKETLKEELSEILNEERVALAKVAHAIPTFAT
jgi:hypothetical protein